MALPLRPSLRSRLLAGLVLPAGLVSAGTGLTACSDPPSNGQVAVDVAEDGAGTADAAKTDAKADSTADTAPDVADLQEEDAPEDLAVGTDVADTAEPEQDVDWSELLDPVDVGESDGETLPTGPVGDLYAHTADDLYKLDLKAGAVVHVGKWTYDKNKGVVTDIALDQVGKLFAITHDDLFECSLTAKCKWLAALPETFNGMTFVPKGTVDPVAEALIGISEDGDWTRISIAGTKVTLKKLGSYGGGWLSSGDAFSVIGIGTYATLKGKSTTDSLALVDPKTGKIQKIIGETGVKNLFGLAWWAGVFYGFSSDGNAYTLDVTSGKATKVQGIATPQGVKWWGAGVSTRAAGQ